MNIKRIIREEINNDLQWIKDTKSDEDIAQEIVNKTKMIKSPNYDYETRLMLTGEPKDSILSFKVDNFITISNTKTYPHYRTSEIYDIENFYNDFSTYFSDYLKSNYGIEDLNRVSRIWKRYMKGFRVKVDKDFGDMNESTDFNWVDEIPTYDFHNGEYYIDISELDDDEACEVQQTILNMGIEWKESVGLQKRFCDSNTTKGYIIQNATLYRTTYDWGDYKEIIGNLDDGIYINGRTDLLA